MNISEQPLDGRYLRRHPKSYTEEPIGKIEFDDPTFRKSIDTLHDEGMKLGGRSVLNAKVKELIRELDELRCLWAKHSFNVGRLEWVTNMLEGELSKERKRSARWKAVAKCYHESYYTLEELVTELLEVEQ